MTAGKKRCAACGKPAAAELCDGCGAAFQRIYGNQDQDQERAMATKKTATKGTTKKTATPREVAPATTEQEKMAPEKLREFVDDIGAEACAAAKAETTAEPEPPPAGPVHDVTCDLDEDCSCGAEAEEPADESEEAEEPAPVSGTTKADPEKYAWLKRVNALRTLRKATKLLEKYDYAQWGVSGVSASLALLKNAATQLQALRKDSSSKAVVVGAKVRLVEKWRPEYEGILEAEDMTGLTVKALRKGTCAVTTATGDRLVLPTARLEVES